MEILETAALWCVDKAAIVLERIGLAVIPLWNRWNWEHDMLTVLLMLGSVLLAVVCAGLSLAHPNTKAGRGENTAGRRGTRQAVPFAGRNRRNNRPCRGRMHLNKDRNRTRCQMKAGSVSIFFDAVGRERPAAFRGRGRRHPAICRDAAKEGGCARVAHIGVSVPLHRLADAGVT